MDADDNTVERTIRSELTKWFGPAGGGWRHLKTDRIVHALPEQPPPMPDPTVAADPIRPGILVLRRVRQRAGHSVGHAFRTACRGIGTERA